MNFTSSAPPLPNTETQRNGHSAMYPFPDASPTPSKRVEYLRMFWDRRRFFIRVGVYAVLASTLLARPSLMAFSTSPRLWGGR